MHVQVEVDRCKMETLRQARVIGLTTAGLANNHELIQALRPKVGGWVCGCVNSPKALQP